MRRGFLQMVVLVAIGSAVGLGFNAVSPKGIPLKGGKKAAVESQNIRMMLTDEVRYYLDQKGTLIVDSRSPEEYSLGHIPGAVNVPHEKFEDSWKQNYAKLKNASMLIVYCSGGSCGTSEEVAKLLQEKGLSNLAIFSDGLPGWMKAKLPINTGEKP